MIGLDYASKMTREIMQKYAAVKDAVALQILPLVSHVRLEFAGADHMGRTTFVGHDGADIAKVTVRWNADRTAIDIVPEVCFQAEGT